MLHHTKLTVPKQTTNDKWKKTNTFLNDLLLFNKNKPIKNLFFNKIITQQISLSILDHLKLPDIF